MGLFLTIVLDGVGIGAQPDAIHYGDEQSHTLKHVLEVAQPKLPFLTKMGLGNITTLPHVVAVPNPIASFGFMQEISAGKDSTTGHWELAGIQLDKPFPTYPTGFPQTMIEAFCERIGVSSVLGNIPASGTTIIEQYGKEHLETGKPIVYTSADSVFQVATHVDIVPLERLYQMCTIAREEICIGNHAVGRVIARPFKGENGAFNRISEARKDYSLKPKTKPIQSQLQVHGIKTIAVGKIADLFGGVGFDTAIKTKSNEDGMAKLLELLQAYNPSQPTFIWINLVDFDQEYGHRNNPIGFAKALETFDEFLPSLLKVFPKENARLVITADHGNDPTTPSTDHSREFVPLLVYNPEAKVGRSFGKRETFGDHAASLAKFFAVPFAHATPF